MLKHSPSSIARLHELLMDVSDPHSAAYGQHRTLDELRELSPIPNSAVDAVTTFILSEAPLASIRVNPNHDIISVSVQVKEAEALFAVKLAVFLHNATGTRLIRATSGYSLPADIAELVAVVGDLFSLPRINTPLRASGAVGAWPNACSGLSGCSGKVTPAVLKQRYSVPLDNTGMTAANNSFGVAEFEGQTFLASDIAKFSQGCDVGAPNVSRIIGGNSPATAGVESELDIEYSLGIAPGIPLTVIYSNAYSLLDWVTALSAMSDPPLVNSVSYGNDEKQQTSAAYMESCNVQFMKAGLRGISILFASGDQGVCGREGCGIVTKRFKPDFPAGSPYITAVGGTDFAGTDIGDETAWSLSGGGFSDTFDIPSWQADAVGAYKKQATLPPATLWNNTGRGYPDIAALGGQKNPYCVVVNGGAEGVAGTSAASPTAAAIFARLNGVRLAAGKPPLGFLNPFIYQNPNGFNDVTTGNNKCTCGIIDREGFTATTGWDPVTGLGTPNMAALLKVI